MYRCLFLVLALAACSRPTPRINEQEAEAPGATPAAKYLGGDAGPPCAVAAGGGLVFLGWRAARDGQEVVACDPQGRPQWAHHQGPGVTGVRSLAADDRAVYVLADFDGTKIYRLDAQTGAAMPWEGRPDAELAIASLWGDPKTKIDRADWITASNGRVYVTFGKEEFIAALDARTGAYVATLTGPRPGQMALSTTPLRDPETGAERPIDFGIAAIAGHGLAYFLMEHEPPWVMMSTTVWLEETEQITALTAVGDTMKTDKVTIYTALGAPHHQVQLRPADAADTFVTIVGKSGGRVERGPWIPEALRDIRSLAVDAVGQLWIAEGDEKFGRFTVWTTEGKDGKLVREITGPIEAATAATPF